MTKVAIVDGCNIFIYREVGGQHHEKHFHVTGPGWSASVPLDEPEKYRGELPRNKRKRTAIEKVIEDLNNDFDVEWIEGS